MTPPILAIAITGLFVVTTWLAIWSRSDTWGRSLAVAVFLLGTPAVWAATVEMLGHHRPMWSVHDLAAGDYHVLTGWLVQDEGIYLYLIDPSRIEPRPIVLPWDNGVAEAIQRALDSAPDGKEGQFVMRYEPSIDETDQQFHPIPQPPALPPKINPEAGMTFHQPEG